MSFFKRTIILSVFVIVKLLLCEGAEGVSRSAQETSPPYPYTEEEVFFQNLKDHVRLAGTLSLPLTHGPFPAVVLCTGLGPQDRDGDMFGHKPFLLLAKHLTRLGIAVLRVDDRGVGKSAGNFSQATSEDFAADALAGVRYLKTRKEIARGKIGLLGHCEGGLIAAIAAARSHDVSFVVMMAGPGLKGDQIVLGPGGVEHEGWIREELIAQNRAAQERIVDVIKEEKDPEAAEARIGKEAEIFTDIAARIRAEAPESKRKTAAAVAAAIEGQTRLFLSPWFRFYLLYDPRPALMKVECPVLALYGEKDTQVPAKENLATVREALAAGGNKDYTILLLPNLNHLFQTAKTGAISEYKQIGETMSTLALETVSDWILKRTSGETTLSYQSGFHH